MLTRESVKTISLIAGADLSADQYKFVALNNLGQVVLATSGDAIGVLSTPNTAGKAVSVDVSGIVRVKSGVTRDAGATVAATGTGLVGAPSTGNILLGHLLEAAVSGKVVSMIFRKMDVSRLRPII